MQLSSVNIYVAVLGFFKQDIKSTTVSWLVISLLGLNIFLKITTEHEKGLGRAKKLCLALSLTHMHILLVYCDKVSTI